MQKLAATIKNNDIDTKTVFASQLSDSFLKKIMIKWNIINYIKTKTR